MGIEIKNISKNFGKFQALKEISLHVPAGELVALLGPSGSGKSTLLRIIAGLDAADQGTILFQGEDAAKLHIRERKVGFVFQHYALFKHMTVFENVAFGLNVLPRKTRPAKKEIRDKVFNLLKLVQLDWTAFRYPHELSGGQRQRIALARVLAIEPKVLLLDEPFGALDAKVRKELRNWLRRLHDEVHITSVFVTHDQEEAMEVADRIVVMNEGKIEQIGTPEEIYEHPANPFVFNFLGSVNLFHGRIFKGCALMGNFEVNLPEYKHLDDTHDAVGYVRPHDLEVQLNQSGSDFVEVVIGDLRCIGPLIRLELKKTDTGEIIQAEISRKEFHELKPKIGQTVFVRPRKLKVFVN